MEDIKKHHEDSPGVCKKENEKVDKIKKCVLEDFRHVTQLTNLT